MTLRNRLSVGLVVIILVSAFFLPVTHSSPKPTISSINPRIISKGEKITIKGENLVLEGAIPKVKIDGNVAMNVELDSDKNVTVVVESAPKEKRKDGEYQRSLVVVNDQESEPIYFHQINWSIVLNPRVFFPLVFYVCIILVVVLIVRRSVFKSKTGELSLSKIQMGVWTFVFGLAYVILAAGRKEFLDITEGMFWLMGISSATAVGAKAIVIKNGIDPKAPFPSKLFMDYNSNDATFMINKSSLDKMRNMNLPEIIAEKIEEISHAVPVGEEDFLKDLEGKIVAPELKKYKSLILKCAVHESGYRLSLHRCQMAVWTIIILCIYVIDLFYTMRLPEIPDKLLVLMGISGGTYLGFNFPKPKDASP